MPLVHLVLVRSFGPGVGSYGPRGKGINIIYLLIILRLVNIKFKIFLLHYYLIAYISVHIGPRSKSSLLAKSLTKGNRVRGTRICHWFIWSGSSHLVPGVGSYGPRGKGINIIYLLIILPFGNIIIKIFPFQQYSISNNFVYIGPKSKSSLLAKSLTQGNRVRGTRICNRFIWSGRSFGPRG